MGNTKKEIYSEINKPNNANEPAEETPITLTKNAADKVREIMEKEDISLDQALRIGVKGGGCAGFEYDIHISKTGKTDTDIAFSSQNINIIVDQMSLMYLMGTTIDYIDDLMGAGFSFNNPNVSASCGCSKSFSV